MPRECYPPQNFLILLHDLCHAKNPSPFKRSDKLEVEVTLLRNQPVIRIVPGQLFMGVLDLS